MQSKRKPAGSRHPYPTPLGIEKVVGSLVVGTALLRDEGAALGQPQSQGALQSKEPRYGPCPWHKTTSSRCRWKGRGEQPPAFQESCSQSRKASHKAERRESEQKLPGKRAQGAWIPWPELICSPSPTKGLWVSLVSIGGCQWLFLLPRAAGRAARLGTRCAGAGGARR